MTWRPYTPEERTIVERMVNGGVWQRILFECLDKGDIIRMYSPDGQPIDPVTHRFLQPGEDHVMAMVKEKPFRNEEDEVGW